ncbi:hypothetical protein AXF42_Ash021660 [Apostasia shenzhenica]|uniref:Uncharacterized protein n=1 Tax=Apostasia shenzhenica TaxID=1088818 RepID=A0A2H9ZYD3_9ASPA|nr:hypothetical protein AXF42_Ash021660 [Apostasia shenzhenica]
MQFTYLCRKYGRQFGKEILVSGCLRGHMVGEGNHRIWQSWHRGWRSSKPLEKKP